MRKHLLVVLCFGLAAFAQQKAPAKDPLWDDLSAGNARFIEGKPNSRDLVADRTKLAKTQSPKVAVLACSDSRVAPELLFDKTVGDLFVVRDAGNSPDPVAIGSLEYAVEHLGTTDDCGFSPFCDDTSTSRETAFAKIRARVLGTKLAEEHLGGDV